MCGDAFTELPRLCVALRVFFKRGYHNDSFPEYVSSCAATGKRNWYGRGCLLWEHFLNWMLSQ